ncbi:MAG: hypothetical protein NC079_01170 [Clostridium sp.]|nr:hypothetical protein [Acetatifactor muris]MCM1526041.1 hypothetical protein [Bacteroides sp.]MCM1562199.1 hypothetical protein [Clostridium sp.]
MKKIQFCEEYRDKYFYISLAILACLMGVFYSEYIGYGDIPEHTVIAKALLFEDVGFDADQLRVGGVAFPLYHYTQKMIHLVGKISYESAAALCLPLSILVSVLLYRKLFSMLIAEDTVRNRYFADFAALGATLFGMARGPWNDWNYYKLCGSPNPFHSPTLLFVRPFGIACFIYFIRFVREYRKDGSIKSALLFGGLSLLSIAAKPSYAVVFLPAMGLYTLY